MEDNEKLRSANLELAEALQSAFFTLRMWFDKDLADQPLDLREALWEKFSEKSPLVKQIRNALEKAQTAEMGTVNWATSLGDVYGIYNNKTKTWERRSFNDQKN